MIAIISCWNNPTAPAVSQVTLMLNISAHPRQDIPNPADAVTINNISMINRFCVPLNLSNQSLTPGTYENSSERITPADNEMTFAVIFLVSFRSVKEITYLDYYLATSFLSRSLQPN